MNRTSYWAPPLRDKPLRALRESLCRKDFCGADQVLFERSAAIAAGPRSSLLRRPGTHGQPAYFRQLLARGPIARLHRKSARYRTVVRRAAGELVSEKWRVDPHRDNQSVEPGVRIAALPQQLHRRLQRDGAVEHRGPSPAAFALVKFFLAFLPCNYFWCHRSKNP